MKKLLNAIGILSILQLISFILYIILLLLFSIELQESKELGLEFTIPIIISGLLLFAISIALFVLGIIVIVKSEKNGLIIATGILSILSGFPLITIATIILAYISLCKIK